MVGVIEPVCAGLLISLINKWIFNNTSLWSLCSGNQLYVNHEDDLSSSSTSINDSFEAHVIHMH